MSRQTSPIDDLTRWMLMAVLAASLAAPLGACGKKGTLEPPADEEVTYPRSYPRQ